MEGEPRWPATSPVPGGDVGRGDGTVGERRARTQSFGESEDVERREDTTPPPLLRQAPASGVSDVARKGGDIRTSVWGVIG